MTRQEGLVVELRKGLAVVLTPDGQFKQVPAREGWQLGQEVPLQPAVVTLPRRRRPVSPAWAVAAALILVLLLPGVLSIRGAFVTQNALAAYVAVDINPSLELQVSSAGKVLEATAVNADAAGLLKQVSLRGVVLQEAVRRITEQAVSAGYLSQTHDNMVLITVTPSSGDTNVSAGLARQVQASEDAARAVLQGHQLLNAVATLTAPPAVRDTAKKEGLSTGKLLVASEAVQEGAQITPEDLRKEPLSKVLEKSLGNGKGDDKKAVGDFLIRVKDKDHGNQRDKVKAVDDFMQQIITASQPVLDGQDGPVGQLRQVGQEGEGDGQTGPKDPPEQTGKKTSESGQGGQTAGSAGQNSQTPQKSGDSGQSPAVPAQPPAGNADEHGNKKKENGSGDDHSTRSKRPKRDWQEQLRELLDRVFGGGGQGDGGSQSDHSGQSDQRDQGSQDGGSGRDD